MTDLLIIGGGMAGLTAAIYALRAGKSVLLTEKETFGGQITSAPRVENYPGMPGVSGGEMLEQMTRQAADLGVTFHKGHATSILPMGERFGIAVESDYLEAGCVILTTGVTRGKPYPGESELLGRGVSYCATCDGMMYRNRPVAVIGLREDAPEEAEFLRSIGCQVEYFDRSRARDYRILGEQKVTGLAADGTEYPVDGVFILRPGVAPDMLLPGLETDRGTIVTDREMRTNIPGVFAAGDCTGAPYQIAKSVGEGNIAALSAVKYLDSKKE